MFVNRTWTRTEGDDFKLNVEPRLDALTEALPVVVEGVLLGWRIQGRYA